MPYFSSRPSPRTQTTKRTLWSVIPDPAPWPHWLNTAGTPWPTCPTTPCMMSSLLPPMFMATPQSPRCSASSWLVVWNPIVRGGGNLTKTMEREKVKLAIIVRRFKIDTTSRINSKIIHKEREKFDLYCFCTAVLKLTMLSLF